MSAKYIHYSGLRELGITHPRHVIEAMTHAGGFPRPIAKNGSSMTWLRADVESWIENPSQSFDPRTDWATNWRLNQ
jgi:hypothetical protein